jgi:hypothetical protein
VSRLFEKGRGPTDRELLTDEQMLEWMESVPWRFAHSMPAHPHFYTLKRQQDPRRFEAVVRTILARGYDRKYLGRKWRSLDVGRRHYVWFHTSPSEAEEMGLQRLLEITILVNRAEYPQDRLF